LRELERIGDSYRDQLQSNMTKYQEAVGRENSPATPADARVIARASVPQEPSFPKKVPTLLFGTIAGFVFSLGGVAASELLSGRNVRPRAPQVGSHQNDIFEPLKAFGRSAAVSRAMAEEEALQEPSSEEAEDPEIEMKSEAETGRRAGPSNGTWKAQIREQGRGVRIVATTLAEDEVAIARLIDFSRELTRQGHPIVVELDPHSVRLAALVGDRPHNGLGLTDLVDGKASFGEVIHRDHASRLHFVSFGMARSFEPEEFDLVLDALSQTYDFLVIAAPSLASSDLAKALAAHADFVTIAASGEFAEAHLEDMCEQLHAAGAAEIVVLDGLLEEEIREVA
jgi:tyrosine-protein kinase Etk/Wzc